MAGTKSGSSAGTALTAHPPDFDRSSPDRLMSRSEVEERYGITKRFLEVAAVRGNGPPFVKIGRSVRYRIRDLDAWIEARRHDPSEAFRQAMRVDVV